MEADPTFDVAIVGSGPAGLAVASRLVGRGLSLVLIEAGNAERDRHDEQDSLSAENEVGPRHPAAHLYRRRMLGGSSTVWGGRCIPFDQADYLIGGDGTGWPIDPAEIERHQRAAADFLDCGEPQFDEAAFDTPAWRSRSPQIDLDLDLIERFSRPTNLWRKMRDSLRAQSDLRLLTDHVVVRVDLSSDGTRVEGLRTIDRRSGCSDLLRARHVVLACGGIETARLLLASRNVHLRGIGNHSDQLGRHYMTHLIGDVGELDLSPAFDQARIDYRRTRDGVYARSLIRLSPALRLRERLPNAVWRPVSPPFWNPSHHDPILSAVHLAKALLPKEYHSHPAEVLAQRNGWRDPAAHVANILRDPGTLAAYVPVIMAKRILARRKLPSVFLLRPDRHYRLEINAEQLPDPSSRITLGDSRDHWGMPRIRLDWQVTAPTLEGVRQSLAHLAELMPRHGFGRLLMQPDQAAEGLISQGGHHIGTTRMGTSPERGVVDSDCTVFGVPNLHVAGASVFPTSGAVNPTLLLTCLAFRLADHLLDRLAPAPVLALTTSEPALPRPLVELPPVAAAVQAMP
ncbi:GMC oxidoreductase [Cereibacter sediminicola]|uniref:GMC oxidoreductase n=1 Tax=Cereibacter sediminicola TaxID=2584941 RepID=UPI00119DED70|nr:GMC family oxidoreductase [Cereibacter sediminicola]